GSIPARRRRWADAFPSPGLAAGEVVNPRDLGAGWTAEKGEAYLFVEPARPAPGAPSDEALNDREVAMATKPYPVTRTEAEWRALLTPEQYAIMRQHGTEPPGSCALNYEKRAGAFLCAGCDQPLFVSKQKFESGTGWPSFNEPEAGTVETSPDE